MKPCVHSSNPPASTLCSTEFAPVLCRRLRAVGVVRADQVDSVRCQTSSQWVTVVGFFVGQSILGRQIDYGAIEQPFNVLNFMAVCIRDDYRQGSLFSIHQNESCRSDSLAASAKLSVVRRRTQSVGADSEPRIARAVSMDGRARDRCQQCEGW